MNAYSMDLRERIVRALECGERVVVVAARFGVCERTVRAYRARARAGALASSPRPGRAPRLRPEQEEAFVALVGSRTTWTLDTLAGAWQEQSGQELARSTLHDHLKRLGGKFKKNARGARTR